MIRARAVVMAGAVAAALLAASGPAHAYVRYRTEAGTPWAWGRTCLGLVVYPAGIAAMMPADEALAAAAAATAAWSTGRVAGTALEIQIAAGEGNAPAPAFDGQSALAFRSDRWCNVTDAPGVCTYDQGALALTTVFARKSTGEIMDADIEVNAAVFMWSDLELDTQASATTHDLQNALTHEVGHFIGLDHPCVVPGTAPGERPVDDLGAPAPDCDAAPPAIMESTMFPAAQPGDQSKRTLAADDEHAVREIYPAGASAPAVCAPPDPKLVGPRDGCAVGGGAPVAPPVLVVLLLALVWVAIRTPRSSPLPRETRERATPRSRSLGG